MTGIPEQEFVRRSKIPETMRDYSLDSWPGSAKPLAMALEFVESWPPKKPLIFLTGTVGGGKTGLSVGIAREVWKRHHMVARFMTAPGLLRRFHATFGEDATESTEEVHREMDSAALVILDDYGTEKSTDFAAQEMFRLINTRYEQGKPLIVTTNLDMLSLDARITSRLRDTSRAYWLEFKGADRRLA